MKTNKNNRVHREDTKALRKPFLLITTKPKRQFLEMPIREQLKIHHEDTETTVHREDARTNVHHEDTKTPRTALSRCGKNGVYQNLPFAFLSVLCVLAVREVVSFALPFSVSLRLLWVPPYFDLSFLASSCLSGGFGFLACLWVISLNRKIFRNPESFFASLFLASSCLSGGLRFWEVEDV
jgi:hypothetical protein